MKYYKFTNLLQKNGYTKETYIHKFKIKIKIKIKIYTKEEHLCLNFQMN